MLTDRQAELLGTIGVRQARIARDTGTLVYLVDRREHGADDEDGGRWETVCDDHGFVCSHDTLALARAHAAAPLGWCEQCAGIVDEDHHDAHDRERMAPSALDLCNACEAAPATLSSPAGYCVGCEGAARRRA